MLGRRGSHSARQEAGLCEREDRLIARSSVQELRLARELGLRQTSLTCGANDIQHPLVIAFDFVVCDMVVHGAHGAGCEMSNEVDRPLRIADIDHWSDRIPAD